MHPDTLNIIRNYGEYFGYPNCCINEFVSDILNGTKYPRDLRDIKESNFVPCTLHFNLIINGEINASDLINNNRKFHIPYPGNTQIEKQLFIKNEKSNICT